MAQVSIIADDTVKVLDRLARERGAPTYVRCDNGPELTAHALRDWCRFSMTETAFVEPGAPWQNPFVKSFNGRVRDELIDVEQFSCLAEARVLVADWREDYTTTGRTRRLRCRRRQPSRLAGPPPRTRGASRYVAARTIQPTLTRGGPMNGVRSEDQKVLRSEPPEEPAHGDIWGDKPAGRRRRLTSRARWVIEPT